MRLALAIASFVILIVHGLVFYNQFFHKWERHQTAYFDQARAMAKTDPERAALDGRNPRIEQIIVTAFGSSGGEKRVDRCTTCHIGNDDPRFKDHAQPLRSHPFSEAMGDRQVNGQWERRHKFSDFGCTVCHDGQGRGLETFDAHGEDHYWPSPLLGYVTQNWRGDFRPKLKDKVLMQANCAQCHTEENFKSAPLVAKGRQLFFEKNCYGCHKVEGMSAGTLAPDLSEAGKKFKPDYLWESIVEPRANSATSFMPKFNLSDEEVKALVIFLKSRRGVNFSETSLDRYRAGLNKGKAEQPAGTTAETVPAIAVEAGGSLVALGERLINDRSCLACHKLGNRDGGVAPDLSFEGLLKDDKWTMDHFRDPRSRISDSIMPTFNFQDSEYQAMTAYLMNLKTPPSLGDSSGIYSTLCSRCHGDMGDGKGKIAVYLDPYPRDLTKAGFMSSKSDERLMNSIKNGVDGTSMPAWERVLSDDQIRGVLDHVRKNYVKEPARQVKSRQVPDTNPIAADAASVKRGEQIFLQRCTGCHGKKADGKGPNSMDIQPRPRNLRNADFMNSTSDRRLFESILYGVQGTAMQPWVDYGLTQKEVGDLVNYLRSFNKARQEKQ